MVKAYWIVQEVVQLLEHKQLKLHVRGSIPSFSTMYTCLDLAIENNAAAQLQSSNAEAPGSTEMFELSGPVQQDKRIYPYALEDLIGKAFI
jgi:hypothetical protein